MKQVELYDHQLKAVAKLHNGSILCGGVGTGKSRVAMRYYIEKEAPKDVYVITTAKKRDSIDWETEAVLHGVGTGRSGTFHGVIKVDSWNNLGKYTDVENAFFIFDEQRLVGSGAWVKSFYKIAKKNNWILLSATPGDTWLDYIPVFVANGYYKNRTEFLREHVVYSRFSKFPKVERYIGVGRLVKYRNSLLVDMPYERHTTRKINIVPVDYDQDLYKRVMVDRWHVYEDRPLRDVAELYSVMRKVANSDSSRIRMIQMLLKEHPRLIVFYSFDYELEILRTLLEFVNTTINGDPCGPKTSRSSSKKPTTQIDGSLEVNRFVGDRSLDDGKNSGNEIAPKSTSTKLLGMSNPSKKTQMGLLSAELSTKTSEILTDVCVAEWNGHKHEPVPKTDSWVYLVQYRAGAEGWNCVETDTIVFYSLTYSYRDFHQAQGRTDRLNTLFTTLNYYVLKSESYIDKAIWKSLSIKQDFNERKDVSKMVGVMSEMSI